MPVRTPAANNAAKAIEEYLRGRGITVSHMDCLEIAARAQGFKNAQHLSKVTRKGNPTEPEKRFVANLFFGSEEVHLWERAQSDKKRKELLSQATEVDYASPAELAAYLRGVDDASGWMDYAVYVDEPTEIALSQSGASN